MKTRIIDVLRVGLVTKLMVMVMTFSMVVAGIAPATEAFACDDWDDDYWEEELDEYNEFDNFWWYEECWEDYLDDDYWEDNCWEDDCDDWCDWNDGYLDEDWDEEYWEDEWEDSYSVDEANQLNGLFLLSSDGLTLTQIYSETEPGSGIRSYDNNKVDWWLCTVEPVKVQSGEKIVLTGTEWSRRSDADKQAMTIYYQEMHLLGYGNYWSLNDLKASDIEMLNGIDISRCNSDIDSINSAISGQNIKYHTHSYSSTNEDLLLNGYSDPRVL